MATGDDRREELIRAGFEAWEAGDVDATLALCDPEIEVFAPPEIGNPGVYRGIEGFLEWTQDWFDAWEDFRQELVAIEMVGDTHALVRVNQTGVGKGSGIEVEQEATYVFQVRGDRLTYLALFLDHANAGELARERESEAAD